MYAHNTYIQYRRTDIQSNKQTNTHKYIYICMCVYISIYTHAR